MPKASKGARAPSAGLRRHFLLLSDDAPAGASRTDKTIYATSLRDDCLRFVVPFEPIEIGPAAVLPLTLSLNELCTNAVKYGALSNPTGRVHSGRV
jgi:hypothetical protein